MIVKDLEAIERMIYRLTSLLETDITLSDDEKDSINMALDALKPLSRNDARLSYPSRLADNS